MKKPQGTPRNPEEPQGYLKYIRFNLQPPQSDHLAFFRRTLEFVVSVRRKKAR